MLAISKQLEPLNKTLLHLFNRIVCNAQPDNMGSIVSCFMYVQRKNYTEHIKGYFKYVIRGWILLNWLPLPHM